MRKCSACCVFSRSSTSPIGSSSPAALHNRSSIVVVARNLRKLLLHHGSHVQTRLVLIDLRLPVLDFRLSIDDFKAIRLQLAFQFQQRCALRIERRRGRRPWSRTIVISSTVRVRNHPLARGFEQRDLLSGLAHIGIFIGVVRGQVGQLRLQLIELLVDIAQTGLLPAFARFSDCRPWRDID